MTWDEQSILALIRAHYREYEPLYMSFRKMISRADVARAFILHRYGGIYADMDYMPLRDIEAFVADEIEAFVPRTACHVAALGKMGKKTLNNALILSSAGNPLWLQEFLPLVDYISSPDTQGILPRMVSHMFKDYRVARETGPFLWTQLVRQRPKLLAPPKTRAQRKRAIQAAAANAESANLTRTLMGPLDFDTLMIELPPSRQSLLPGVSVTQHNYIVLFEESVLYPLRQFRFADDPQKLATALQGAAAAGAVGFHKWDNAWVGGKLMTNIAMGRVSPWTWVIMALIVVAVFLLLGGLLLRRRWRRPQ